ncbi:hypothetical protein HAX54_022848, partial [Datura stramonium]|nr:hypothetical protein [Datura stramonium]
MVHDTAIIGNNEKLVNWNKSEESKVHRDVLPNTVKLIMMGSVLRFQTRRGAQTKLSFITTKGKALESCPSIKKRAYIGKGSSKQAPTQSSKLVRPPRCYGMKWVKDSRRKWLKNSKPKRYDIELVVDQQNLK